MSHLKERIEKNCLNCNAQVHGRFCHICGQENVETRESAWHLIRHFLEDLTHFDGKFFSTYRHIALRPGYLPQEYFRGRRASYLNPLRMYIFTSAFFFLIFFSITSPSMNEPEPMRSFDEMKKEMAQAIQRSEASLKVVDDSLTRQIIQHRIDTLQYLTALMLKDSVIGMKSYHSYNMYNRSGLVRDEYTSLAVYDSIQANRSANQRDGWFKRMINRKLVGLHYQARLQGVDPAKKLLDKFLHTFPQLLFISLPLTSLILSLLYVRRGQFYYVHHLIFTVYLYIFSFVLSLMLFGINASSHAMDWSWLGWVVGIGSLIPWVYQYKAMRRFYGQSVWKTGLKFALYNLITLVVILILFALFFFISIFQLG